MEGSIEVATRGDIILRILKVVRFVVPILSMLVMQASFASFIYEEACQLQSGVIKARMRCKMWEEAGQMLNWYETEILADAFAYQFGYGSLNPITHPIFTEYFYQEYRWIKKQRGNIDQKIRGYSEMRIKPPYEYEEWRKMKRDVDNWRRDMINQLTSDLDHVVKSYGESYVPY